MTTEHSPRRVVVTTHPDDGTVALTIYEKAERLVVVPIDARRAVAVAGDLIEAARTIMDRQR